MRCTIYHGVRYSSKTYACGVELLCWEGIMAMVTIPFRTSWTWSRSPPCAVEYGLGLALPPSPIQNKVSQTPTISAVSVHISLLDFEVLKAIVLDDQDQTRTTHAATNIPVTCCRTFHEKNRKESQFYCLSPKGQ